MTDFDTLLTDCLDAVTSGRLTIAECLERYPDFADELKPALQVGLLTARLKKPEMSAEAASTLEARLRAAMEAPPSPPLRLIHLPPALGRLAAAVLIVAALAFGGGGLVSASASSLPGDPLYGLKRLWEAIILALSPLTGSLDDLWLSVVETRLDEVEALAAADRLMPEALDDLYRAMAQAILHADADSQARALQVLAETRASLSHAAPPPGGETIHRALLDWIAPQVESGQLLPPTSVEPPQNIPPAATPAGTLTTVPMATDTPTTPTLTPTETLTAAPTGTDTPTATFTRTPTPSRTPTLTPTATFTPTATPTPTLTWTPLPLPERPTDDGAPTAAPSPADQSISTPIVIPTWDATLRVRATERAIQMTQTAGPPLTPTAGP
ncbi:MAG: hypothetical protein BroJett038_29660 [Chloroflexota bacterium]|nr:MAG: hypothetical protein BroJett038_29660 [Chloroflexota bacterium]